MKRYLILAILSFSVFTTGCSSSEASPNPQQTQEETTQDTSSQSNTKSVDNTQTSADDSTELGARKNPAKINDKVNFTLDNPIYGNGELELSLLEVKRGDEALKYIKGINESNDDPDDGKEYAILKFKISNVKNLSSEDKPVETNFAQFKLADSNFTVIDQINLIALGSENDLSAKLYEGSSKEGLVVFQVNPNEPFYAVYQDEVWFMAE